MDLSKITAMVVDNGRFAEFACVLARTYGKVFYCPLFTEPYPSMKHGAIGTGMEGLTVVQKPWDIPFEKIDLWVFPTLGFGSMQRDLVRQGALVFGARMGEDLELERGAVKDLLKRNGMDINPWVKITGTKALREYLKDHDNLHVKTERWRADCESFKSTSYKESEPLVDEIEHSLGPFKYIFEFIVEEDLPDCVELGVDCITVDGQFPQNTYCGIEVKDAAFAGAFMPWKDIPEPVTRVNEVLAPSLRRYQYRGPLSTEVRIDKKLVPHPIDMTCFDDKTEVLTDDGWKLFKDCDFSDQLATRKATGEIEFQHPVSFIQKVFDGNMILLTNRRKTIECLVTPDHDVLRSDRHNKKVFKQKAGSLTDKGFIPRTGFWNPQIGKEVFVLPEYHKEWDFKGPGGWQICRKVFHLPSLEISLSDWASFMGWYLSEGSCGNHKHQVTISQTKYQDEVESVLRRLPFAFSKNEKGFLIDSPQLAKYLHQFGLCYEKSVPDYIKNSSKIVIDSFLKTFSLGDGSHRYKDGYIFFTTSKRMADDIQEMVFRSGFVANVYCKKLKGTKMRVGSGKEYTRNHDIYLVRQSNKTGGYWFETKCRKEQYIRSVPYHGIVYCASVPNGTLYVRRNGKPFWSGNCRFPIPPNETYQELYTNIAEMVYEAARGNLVNPKPLAKFGCQVIMRSKGSWGDTNAIPFDLPAKIRRNVKLLYPVKIEGRYYTIPQGTEGGNVGSIVGWGNSLDAARKMCKDVADEIHAITIKNPVEVLDEAEKEFEKAEKFGLRMLPKA